MDLSKRLNADLTGVANWVKTNGLIPFESEEAGQGTGECGGEIKRKGGGVHDVTRSSI